jgi:large subunit ribosomal protein L16
MKNFISFCQKKKKKLYQKTKVCQNNYKNIFFKYGMLGLKSKEAGRLIPKQFELIRQLLTKRLSKANQLFFCLFPDSSISRKPREVRMGKGKGTFFLWVIRVSRGQLLFEICTFEKLLFIPLLVLIKKKLPINTKIINRFDAV